MPQKYKKLYPGAPAGKYDKVIKAPSLLHFYKKNNRKRKWHGNCNIFCKSDTLISFLLKKVCFVPQSGPFSIGKTRYRSVSGRYRKAVGRLKKIQFGSQSYQDHAVGSWPQCVHFRFKSCSRSHFWHLMN